MNIGDKVWDRVLGKTGKVSLVKDGVVNVVYWEDVEQIENGCKVFYSTVSYGKEAVKKFLEVA